MVLGMHLVRLVLFTLHLSHEFTICVEPVVHLMLLVLAALVIMCWLYMKWGTWRTHCRRSGSGPYKIPNPFHGTYMYLMGHVCIDL